MTTHPTDDELRGALALAKVATPEPWRLRHKGGPELRVVGAMKEKTVAEYPYHFGKVDVANLAFIAAARTGWPAAAKALLETRAALRLYYNTPGHQNCGCDACAAARIVLGEEP